MFLKIGLADDIVPNGHLSVRTIQNANNWRNYLTEGLFVVDDLLKTKGLRYYLFLLRYTNGFTVTVSKCFFQSGIVEWIADLRFYEQAKVQLSWSVMQWQKLFKKCKYFIAVMFKGAVTDMRYFARCKFSTSLVDKKNFSLIWQVVFKLGYVFCQ